VADWGLRIEIENGKLKMKNGKLRSQSCGDEAEN
jgi:hypothetical protein